MREKRNSREADIYNEGFRDGIKASLEDSGLHAYYAGVGYGKKAASDKHIGFQNAEHLEEFEKGVRQKDRHFITVQKEQGFFESLFDFKGRRAARNRAKVAKNKKRRSKQRRKDVRRRVKKSNWSKK